MKDLKDMTVAELSEVICEWDSFTYNDIYVQELIRRAERLEDYDKKFSRLALLFTEARSMGLRAKFETVKDETKAKD